MQHHIEPPAGVLRPNAPIPNDHSGVKPPAVSILPDLNSTAKQLGALAGNLDLFYHRGKIVFRDHLGILQVMTGMKFRTWINHQGVVTFSKLDAATGAPIPCSLSCGDAAAILECQSFLKGVRPLAESNGEEMDHE
jgi:hypothetical protein